MSAKMNMTVVVAMSGGVDSSVTAALLTEQGYDVIGITMKTYDYMEVGGSKPNEGNCCDLDAVTDARAVADKLGFPHYVVNLRDEFGDIVIKNFVEEYLQGRTPNPCIVCNREIKWGRLLKEAEALGADYFATGHYARVRFDSNYERYVVSKAVDRGKDQSYVLWGLSQVALKKTLFPLGEMEKQHVRDIAKRFGLENANKRDSFEICFIPDEDYELFVKKHITHLESNVAGGDIVWQGKIVGRHRGYPFYTIGQRKGLGAYGRPMYVMSIDSATNTLCIGDGRDLFHRDLRATNLNLIGRAELRDGMKVDAKVRYKDESTPATVHPENDGRFRIVFDEPKRAISPGQSVVLYDGDDVVGGGIIESVLD